MPCPVGAHAATPIGIERVRPPALDRGRWRERSSRAAPSAVYAERRLVPLLKKRRAGEVHRVMYRLGQGTHPSSGVGQWRAISVPSLISAMKQQADELMAPTVAREGLPPEAEGQPYSSAVAKIYGLLYEFTHPNQPALALSVADPDWALQPPVTDRVLGLSIRPLWKGC